MWWGAYLFMVKPGALRKKKIKKKYWMYVYSDSLQGLPVNETQVIL